MQKVCLRWMYLCCFGIMFYAPGCTSPPDISEIKCDDKTACPTGQTCMEGTCKTPMSCNPFKPCSAGFVCVGGVCQKQDAVCDKGWMVCNQVCVDIQSSMANCGGCGKICPSIFVCSQGTCQQTCASGETECAGSCVDLRGNPKHCGACNKICATSYVCDQGTCVLPCPNGLQECSGQCVDLQAHQGHCGACGKTCANGQFCSKGKCEMACDPGLSACGGFCVDLRVNRLHCGACQRTCTNTEKCAEGACVAKCGVDLTDCGELCVDLDADRNHCGACQKKCGAGESCLAGECKILCPTGQHVCLGKCVSLQTDSLHCGGCDQPCKAGEACSNGACVVNCQNGLTTCVQSCVDTQSDRRHCGTCGVVCKPGEVCSQGKCALSCQISLTDCGGNCVDLLSSYAHCGACGQACTTGQVCSQGKCALRCQISLTDCASQCVDLQTSRSHCGACGKTCLAGEICTTGTCELSCQSGLTNCSGKCVDLQSERSHCGTCGNVCPSGQVCVTGTCKVSCPTGQTNCSGKCVDLQSERAHCGICGNVCPSGQVCVIGTCEVSCPTGQINCSGKCVDIQSERSHCGICGNVCPSGQVCSNGACAVSCVLGQTNCSGLCVNVQSDRAHCGSCGKTCAAGEVCANARCALSCSANQTICAGECVNLKTDRSHCGGCGNACASGKICNNGTCEVSCSSGLTQCAGQCVNVQHDPNHCGGCGTLCGPGSFCMNGICRVPCGVGQTDCGGVCKNLQTDPQHCGACGTTCGLDNDCFSGQCKRPYQLVLGQNYTCALLFNGRVKCWGQNQVGQLGYGDTTNRFQLDQVNNTVDLGVERTARAITAGEYHTCVILDNGSVKCWGRNNLGQLGYGDTTDRTKPDANPIDLGPGRTAKQITAGVRHTCALLDNNTVTCWGYNGFGQLGYSDTTNRTKPNANPIDLGLGRTAKIIGASQHFVCALLDNNTVKCWGYNNVGQLGYGDTTNRSQPDGKIVDLGTGRTAQLLAVGESHVCVGLDDKTVKCWGWNAFGQLGYGDTTNRSNPIATPVDLGVGRTPKLLISGHLHTCALLDDDTVKCWGMNASGQLGYGDSNNRTKPDSFPINIGLGRTAKNVFADYDTTCALLDDHTVKCWGNNAQGLLGYPDTTARNKPDVTPMVLCPFGVCGCPVGQTDCSGVCRNLQTDAQHCGSCGTVCSGSRGCQAGGCLISLVQVQGAWRWNDGSMGVRCNDYKQASAPYSSSQTDGAYWLQVSGNGAIRTWCDQTQGAWMLVGIVNTASSALYDKLGASATSTTGLTENPVTTANLSSGVAAWMDMNAAKPGFTELRLTGIGNGQQTYTSPAIPLSALRIPFGSNGYFLYNNPSGIYWCGGARSYTDLGQGQVDRPAGAPAGCKNHVSLGSGFDYGSTTVNIGLTLCGSDGCTYQIIGGKGYYGLRAAMAFWMR